MSESTKEEFKIELRDLQTLLRKKLGEKLVVVNFNTDSLLPPGENYGSTILKVHAIIKKNNEANEENLYLVAKMLPGTKFQRTIFDSPFTFRKETFLYEHLIPSYQELEREFGLDESQVFDIVPEFYGARFSLKSDEDFDDDAVILMQNLKVLGYYTCDRTQGLDVAHMRTAIVALARFHALGMAMRQHKPDKFEILKERSRGLKMVFNESWEEGQKFLLRTMKDDPEMGIHGEKIEASMTQNLEEVWATPPPEIWSTINHSDFWINNIMFQKDNETNEISNVKFVDFQNYLNRSPLRDLIFFLSVSSSPDVMDNHFDELLNYYYENFIAALKRMKCEVEQYKRDKFDERLKIDAFAVFPRCPFMLRIVTAEVADNVKTDSEEMKNVMMNKLLGPMFLPRMRRCVKNYVEKGWLHN